MSLKKKPDGSMGYSLVMRDEHFVMYGGGYGSRGSGTSRSALSGFMKNFMKQFSSPKPAPRNKQGGLLPSEAKYYRPVINPPPLSRKQRRAVRRLEEGRTHPKVLKEAQDAGAKAYENIKPIRLYSGKRVDPDHPRSHDFWYRAEMAREGAVYTHIVRGASQRRLDEPRPKLRLDPPSTIVNIDRGTIASRRGGEFARRRHHAETTHNSNMANQAADHALERGGHRRQVLSLEDTIASKTMRFPHNQPMSISGGTLPHRHTKKFAQNYAISKGVSRHINKIPNTPPKVRTPYGSNRVGGRGIPRDLSSAITKIGKDNTPPGLMLAIGISGAAEALKESRRRGISFGRYASSAASSPPPYGGRR